MNSLNYINMSEILATLSALKMLMFNNSPKMHSHVDNETRDQSINRHIELPITLIPILKKHSWCPSFFPYSTTYDPWLLC